MPRNRLTSEQLLKRIIDKSGDPKSARAAERILKLGDSVQAQRIGRQASISVRLAGPENRRSWLTLYLIQTTGEFTVWYTYLWERIGIPKTVAAKYESRLVALFGDEVIEGGVSVVEVARKWNRFVPIVQQAAHAINQFVGRIGPAAADLRSTKALSAWEGIVKEQRVYRHSRSRSLRDKALSMSDGLCACCEIPYSQLLGGRGSRVLQVHHKLQLSLRERPKLTDLNDLAVVCANCHMLIHADANAALKVEAVNALWRKYRSRR